jgi:nitrate/nitrite transport system ATP-binding protein
MSYIEIENVGKIFQGADGKPFEALTDVNLQIEEGEFVSIIGHSGCGKSTLLNMVGGFSSVTSGKILVAGKPVTGPGPDRMFVFQNHSLLPWLTVRQNIRLAVDAVYPDKEAGERADIVQEHIEMVSLVPAAEKLPSEISGGMKQRVGIARALATRPKVLMLDEPFGALDALTRGRLQEQVLAIWEAHRITVMMVTHDVEEALLLSDRVVMMANGPRAKVGEIMQVELPRPRTRTEAINHPNYYRLRNELLYFLNHAKKQKKTAAAPAQSRDIASVSGPGLEKTKLTLGFIPLTDCAPLVVAKEKGFFEKHGLEVKLSREPSWKAVTDGVIEGRLDLSMMVAGMPLARTLGGYKGKALEPMVASMVLSRNGNAITLSRKFYERGVRNREQLSAYIKEGKHKRKPIFGMVFPSSMHNLLLRHWLAGGGIDPDKEVEIISVPPPQMVASLAAGNLDGYCVGEPWNARAVHEGLGFVVATDLDIFPGHAEKLLCTTQGWAQSHPKTHVAAVKALLEACCYCDEPDKREEVVQLIAQKKYVNADPIYSSLGMSGSYVYGFGRVGKVEDFNLFYKNHSTRLDKGEAQWVLAQMARWRLIEPPANPLALIDQVYLEDVYEQACKELGIDLPPTGCHAITLADGTRFEPEGMTSSPEPASAMLETAEEITTEQDADSYLVTKN